MILEIAKSSTVRRVLQNLLKEKCYCKRNIFSFSAKFGFLVENKLHFSKYPIIKSTFLTNINSQFSLKCFSSETSEGTIDKITFETVCSETLDSLTEYFEELVESVPHLKNADVTYSDGVLTVNLGPNHGTYVINRQTPNLQIWLSSPTSGPKRYDFINKTWVYRHDKTTLHSLLDKEIKEIVNEEVNFVERCLHAKGSVTN